MTTIAATQTRSSWSKSQDVSRIFDLDRICTLIGVETLTDFDERLFEGGALCGRYDETEQAALAGDATEEEAANMAARAEDEERTDLHKQYRNAVISAAEWLLSEHGLTLVELKDGWRWRLVPETSWRDAASKIIKTINGYGMFEFRDVHEFCSAGPYTVCQAVMNHLGWMKSYAEVYGDVSAEARVERAMRR